MKLASITWKRMYVILLTIIVVRMGNLTKIQISNGNPYTLKEISNAQSVTSIVLRDCSLEDPGIIDHIGRFKNLKTLVLHDVEGDAGELLRRISNPEKLEELKILSTAFKSSPNEIYRFINLKVLELGHLGIKSLPEGLKSLTSLSELRLVFGNHSSLPRDLKEMSCLTKLAISADETGNLPDGLFDLNNITHLEIYGHRERKKYEVPAELGKMKNLKKLTIVMMGEISFPADASFQSLEALDIQFFDNNTLPANIELLTNLRKLSLEEGNTYFDLTERIGLLKNLEKLAVCSCYISNTPESIAQLKKLRRLLFGNTDTTSLSASYRSLKDTITSLYLRNSPIIPNGGEGRLGREELKEIFGEKVFLDSE